MTRAVKERLLLDGVAGKIECVVELPAGSSDAPHGAPPGWR